MWSTTPTKAGDLAASEAAAAAAALTSGKSLLEPCDQWDAAVSRVLQGVGNKEARRRCRTGGNIVFRSEWWGGAEAQRK